MDQLPFDFTTFTLKIKCKKLLLNDWQLVGAGSYNGSYNWVRRLIPDDGFSCVGLMASWINEINIHSHHWAPMFHGQDLWHLNEIYNTYYPNIKPQFRDYQIKEAKQHLDDFIKKVNLLGLYL